MVDVEAMRRAPGEVLAWASSIGADSGWNAKPQRYRVTVFPQMTRWLRHDDAAMRCAEFDRAIARVEDARANDKSVPRPGAG